MKLILKEIFSTMGILLGLYLIVKFAGNVEFAVGLISISFGILAVIWTARARKALSKGSTLKSYTTHFLFSLLFILIFSVLSLVENLFYSTKIIGFAKYLFITIAYILFVFTSYKILHLSKEFGFEIEAKKIKKLIEKKKKLRK